MPLRFCLCLITSFGHLYLTPNLIAATVDPSPPPMTYSESVHRLLRFFSLPAILICITYFSEYFALRVRRNVHIIWPGFSRRGDFFRVQPRAHWRCEGIAKAVVWACVNLKCKLVGRTRGGRGSERQDVATTQMICSLCSFYL